MRPDPKEISHLICVNIRADIEPKEADNAAREIIAYMERIDPANQEHEGHEETIDGLESPTIRGQGLHPLNDLGDIFGPLKPEQLRRGYYGPPKE